MTEYQARLIVHGGAWSIPDEMDADHLDGVQKAMSRVYPELVQGLSALDAVEQAVNMLEENPTFDAGRGAFLNAAGEIELDASIMDGTTLACGAVAAVPDILHPVSLARLVMERTEHVLLVGEGARRFARNHNVSPVHPTELLTPRELEYYEQIKNDPAFTTRLPFDGQKKGTVGAVAMDRYGNLAAATSTGGTPRKLPGRVGDSPIIGAGTYADNETDAASATGWGESIMKLLLCKTACDAMIKLSAAEAAKQVISLLKKRVDGQGGIILIDRFGRYGLEHNTKKMAYAFAREEGSITAGLVVSP